MLNSVKKAVKALVLEQLKKIGTVFDCVMGKTKVMKQVQLNHLNMYGSVVTNLNQNAAIYSRNTVFASAVNTLKSKVTALTALQIGQINHSAGITVTKEVAKSNLIQLTIDHAEAGRAYAAATGNSALGENLKVSTSSLNKLQDSELAPACQDIYNQVNPIIGSLSGYGVTAGTTTNLQTAIGTFIPLVGQPKNARSTAKAFTTAIEQNIQGIQIFLEEQLDSLMRQYKITQQTFHDAYFSDRNMGSKHKRTTVTLKGLIVTAGNQPIKKADVKILSSTRKKKVTKADGKFGFARLHPGSFTVQVSAKGYATQNKSVTQAIPGNVSVTITLVPGSGGTTGGGTTGTTVPIGS